MRGCEEERERAKRCLAPVSDMPYEWQAHTNGKRRADWLGGGGGGEDEEEKWGARGRPKKMAWCQHSGFVYMRHDCAQKPPPKLCSDTC